MKNDLNFTDFLKDVFSNFDKKVGNSGLVSICFEIPCIDLFDVYEFFIDKYSCLLYTSPSPRDQRGSRMPSSA